MTSPKKILFVFGTRPEAIKLCPLVRELVRRPEQFQPIVCVTGQHRAMLDQVLGVFEVKPDIDLNLMQPGQTLISSTSRILAAIEPVFNEQKPDMTVVQGDTTSTFAGSLASFMSKVPIAHVEAGLRTFDLEQPFPEEAYRVLTGRIATLHFAATEGAARNLRNEDVAENSISVTGNTGIDAVLYVRDQLREASLRGADWSHLNPKRKLIVVTAHRRENHGQGFSNICEALLELAAREDVELVYPVHPNPNVQEPVNRALGNHPNIHLCQPLDYVPFVDLMSRAHILITDSGGVQEEGPSLGKPILVLREKTERPEAVDAGTVILVGTAVRKIVQNATRLLDNPEITEAMTRIHNPYGDGLASARIADVIHSFLSK